MNAQTSTQTISINGQTVTATATDINVANEEMEVVISVNGVVAYSGVNDGTVATWEFDADYAEAFGVVVEAEEEEDDGYSRADYIRQVQSDWAYDRI